jgi:aspartate racemase
MRTAPRPAHIGIVACSAEGAALCYRTICAEGPAMLGPHAHPEIPLIIHDGNSPLPTLDSTRLLARAALRRAIRAAGGR